MYERSVKRLEDPELIGALVGALLKAGYGRETIETALIRQAPIDLDILADCYSRLTAASAAMHDESGSVVKAAVRHAA